MSIWDDPAEVQGKANVESMFWAADEGVPWHGLGTPVPTAITTAAEALEASGQGWTVSVEQLITTSGIAITDGRRCGTASARCLWTPVRVVCANTLNQAVNGSKGEGVVIRHTGSLQGKIQEAQRILGLAVRMYDDLEGQFKASAKFKMTDTMRATYFASLFGPGPKGNDEDGTTEEASAKTRKTLDRLHELAETGRGNGAKPVKGSLWSSYNAVTDFIDHERATRVSQGADGSKRGDERSNRLESAWFGQGAQVKERAWTLARAIMDDPAVLNAVPVPSTN
jgi:hypothetical protein